MPRIKFEGFPHTDTYARAGVGGAWFKGDERSVSESEAEYLLRKFPQAFSGDLQAPSQSRAMAAPAARGGNDLLDGSVAQIKANLASGEYDGLLTSLLDAEEAGKTRRGAIKAIKDRMVVVAGGE